MSAIFISHSSADNQQVQGLKDRFETWNHHSVFLDFDPDAGIQAGRSWERTLYRKLRACQAVVAWVTDAYLASYWCFAEIALARMEGKHIFAILDPSLSPGANLPSILTEKQFMDLRKGEEQAYQRLKNGLKELDILGISGDWDPRDPPYLGLSYYDEKHAPVFFGREDEVRAGMELINRGAPNLIMVLGASGSGKSSLTRAGILPRLRMEPDQFIVLEPFRPRQDPFRELADVLERARRRYQLANPARAALNEEIRDQLLSWRRGHVPVGKEAETDPTVAPPPEPIGEAQSEERLHALLAKIVELKGALPRAPETSSFFLNWTVDDLRRITSVKRDSSTRSSTPLATLADELEHASECRNSRVVLVIDQFEELLGYDSEGPDHPANCFLDLLRTTLDAENCPVLVIGTMRSDFLGTFQRNPALRAIDFESLSVGPMKLEGMRKVIEEPAKLAALEIERGLADRLLADTETPDALPLLSFTLWVMWRDYRDDGKLSISDYEELGGLDGAIAREADALLRSAENEGRVDQLRRAFVRMARLSDEGSYARHPINWEAAELKPVHDVLNRFVDRRLLVKLVDDDKIIVEVAHEALFRSWAPLKSWLDENRADLLLRQQIERDSRAWDQEGKSADRLWHGSRLQQAQDLMRREGLSGEQEHFVRTGVRRRRIKRGILAGVIASVFVVLAGFLAFARQQKQRAETERAEAEKILEFMTFEMRDKLGPYVPTAIRRQMLDTVDQYYEKTGRERSGAAKHALVAHFDSMGDQALAEGNTAAALDYYEKSLKLAEELAAAESDDPDWKRSLSVSYSKLGDVKLKLGQTEAALNHYEAFFKVKEELVALDPGNAEYRGDLSVSYSKLGDVKLKLGQTEAALTHYEAASKVLEELVALNPYRRDLSVSYNKLGDVKLQLGQTAAALTHYGAALKVREELAALDPGNARYRRDVLVSHKKLGDVKLKLGQTVAALTHYEASLKVREELVALDPGIAEYRRDLSVSYTKLGDVKLQLGQSEAALTHYEAALKVAEEFVALDPGNAEYRRDLSVSYNKLGEVKLEMGQTDAALTHYEAAFKMKEELVALDPGNAQYRRDLSVSYNKLGDVKLQLGQSEAALTHYEAALKVREELVALDPGNAQYRRDLSVSHNKLGEVKLQLGQSEAAVTHYEAALKVAEELVALDRGNAEYRRDLSISYEKLGDVKLELDQTEAALTHYEAALKVAEELVALDPEETEYRSDLSSSYEKLGDVKLKLGQSEAALTHYEAALKVAEELVALDPEETEYRSDLSSSYENLASVKLKLGQTEAALTHYEAALKVTKEWVARYPSGNAQEDAVMVAEAWGDLTWGQLFARDVLGAITSGEAGMTASPLIWVEGHLAHAYLYAGQMEKALAIYGKNRGKKIEGNDGMSWEELVKSDFAELRSAGLECPGMVEVEKLLGITK